jgi:hypothetical protein
MTCGFTSRARSTDPVPSPSLAPVRTPEETHAAIEALLRNRAVESPPDEAGHRRVWHRAAGGVELLTVLDREGNVVRQTVTLFDDAAHWDAHGGLRAEGTFDPQLEPLRVALGAYQGGDRLLLHLRGVLGVEAPASGAEREPPRAVVAGAAASAPARGWPGRGGWLAAGLLTAALLAALLAVALGHR